MDAPAWLPIVGHPDAPDEPFFDRAASWAVDVSYRELPKPVRRAGAAQLTNSVGAALWTSATALGQRIENAVVPGSSRGNATFFGGGMLSPARAAYGNAALSAAFEFDAELLGGTTSPSCVFVPLAYAESTDADGRELLVAQVVANEITARLGAATAVGPFAGRNAAWIHAAGAAVGRAVIEGDDRTTLAAALANAVSHPIRPIERSAIGSDAGLWGASEAIATGLAAVDRARAGFSGRRDVLDADGGVLPTLSPRPVDDYLCRLGERWHTNTVSITAVPGDSYVAAATEAALSVRGQFDRGRTTINRVDVYGPHAMVARDATARPYLADDPAPVAAVVRSITKAVATALATGGYTPASIDDPTETTAAERIAERVTVRHDPSLTITALRSTPPEGVDFTNEGGSGVTHVIKSLGPSATLRHVPTVFGIPRRLSTAPDLSEFERHIGARVVVHTADGRDFAATIDRPSGVAGSPPAEIRAIARRNCRNALEGHGVSESAARMQTDRLVMVEELTSVRMRDLLYETSI